MVRSELHRATGRALNRRWSLGAAAAWWAGVPIAAAVTGVGIGLGYPQVLLIAVVPIVALVTMTLTGPGRWVVVILAFASGFLEGIFTERLPVGAAGIFFADFLVAGAVVGFVLEWLLKPSELRPQLPRSAVLGVPLLLFAVALMLGAMRGQERYDATLIGMPLRLVGYAAIVAALPGVTPTRALRGLTIVMYSGAVWLAFVAAYHVATGTSATDQLSLSTGGIRYIGIAAATYAAAAFLLAVINLASRRGHELLHLSIALISGFDIIVAYTRTIWLILVVILIAGIVISKSMRGSLAASVPVAAPILLLGVLLTLALVPSLGDTLIDRVSTPAGEDTSVQWRAEAYRTVLAGTDAEPLRGIGFGRTTSFSINGQPNVITGDPHNAFLYVYSGSGVLGVTALALLLLAFAATAYRRWRASRGEERLLVTWCVCAWVLVLVHALSEPVFTSPHFILVFWILMLLPAVVRDRTAGPLGTPEVSGVRHHQPHVLAGA